MKRAAHGALLLPLATGCAHSPAAAPSGSVSPPVPVAAPAVDASTPVRAPTSTARAQTCVTGSSELCLNGIDDNCNGLTDEGCGRPSSDLQFLVVWSEPAVDIDLEVAGPSGELASSATPSTDGLVRSPDCPTATEQCRPRNLERVARATDKESKPGHYAVTVRLRELHGAEPPIRVNLSAHVGSATEEYRLLFHAEHQSMSYAFEVPAPTKAPKNPRAGPKGSPEPRMKK